MADIAEHQKNCPHPIEQQFRSRCLRCAAPILQVARDKSVNFYKQGKKKADKKKKEEE